MAYFQEAIAVVSQCRLWAVFRENNSLEPFCCVWVISPSILKLMGVDDKASQEDYNNYTETARGIVTLVWGKSS